MTVTDFDEASAAAHTAASALSFFRDDLLGLNADSRLTAERRDALIALIEYNDRAVMSLLVAAEQRGQQLTGHEFAPRK